MTTGVEAVSRPGDTLPGWSSVLAVVAHPDDESFGLGAVLDYFARSGALVSVLCLTQGEASTVHGVSGELATLRAVELESAAKTLGLTSTSLCGYPDGALATVPRHEVVRMVSDNVARSAAQGLVVFDPSGVTGHPDHAAATDAALEAAAALGLPVLGWTVPRAVAEQLNCELDTAFVGHEASEVDLVLEVDRDRQRVASLAHASQAVPTSVLWRRLELLGDREHLRWLRRAAGAVQRQETNHSSPSAPDASTMRVEYRTGDRFDIGIRDHVVTVDQPLDIGGEDLGPTPTELFVAGLASCVAFYARRYLRRHMLDATGLVVETCYRMDSKPARVSEVQMSIRTPYDLPPARRDGLLAVASHCTVHNSITTAPVIDITLDDGLSAMP